MLFSFISCCAMDKLNISSILNRKKKNYVPGQNMKTIKLCNVMAQIKRFDTLITIQKAQALSEAVYLKTILY